MKWRIGERERHLIEEMKKEYQGDKYDLGEILRVVELKREAEYTFLSSVEKA